MLTPGKLVLSASSISAASETASWFTDDEMIRQNDITCRERMGGGGGGRGGDDGERGGEMRTRKGLEENEERYG